MPAAVYAGDGLKKPVADGCVLRMSASLTLTTGGTYYNATWDAEDKDDADYWSSGDNTKVYAPRHGWYLVTAHGYSNSEAGTYDAVLLVNGEAVTDELFRQRQYAGSGIAQGLTLAGVYYLSQGDYIQTQFMCTTSTRSILGARFAIAYLGDYVPSAASEIGKDGMRKKYADGCSLRFAGTLNITAANTVHYVPWDTEDVDQKEYWSAGDNTKIYAPRTGWYAIAAAAHSGSNSETYATYVLLNGETVLEEAYGQRQTATTQTQGMSVAALAYLKQGEYFQVGCTARNISRTITGARVAVAYLGDNVPSGSLVTGKDGTTKTFADGATVHLTGSFNLTTANTYYSCDYDTEDYDQADCWAVGSAARVYAPRRGWYYAAASAQSNSDTDTYSGTIPLNGAAFSDEAPVQRQTGGTGIAMHMSMGGVFFLSAGDYLTADYSARVNTRSLIGAKFSLVYLGESP